MGSTWYNADPISEDKINKGQKYEITAREKLFKSWEIMI